MYDPTADAERHYKPPVCDICDQPKDSVTYFEEEGVSACYECSTPEEVREFLTRRQLSRLRYIAGNLMFATNNQTPRRLGAPYIEYPLHPQIPEEGKAA